MQASPNPTTTLWALLNLPGLLEKVDANEFQISGSDILAVQMFQTWDDIFGTCWQQVCEGGEIVVIVRVLAALKESLMEPEVVRVKGTADERQKRKTAGNPRQGFRLTHATTESEDMQREKEHENVKKLISTLDANMVKKLAIRSLRRGIG
ncbi:Hypothetical predicted protein, partial [Paramuricea clavata]